MSREPSLREATHDGQQRDRAVRVGGAKRRERVGRETPVQTPCRRRRGARTGTDSRSPRARRPSRRRRAGRAPLAWTAHCSTGERSRRKEAIAAQTASRSVSLSEGRGAASRAGPRHPRSPEGRPLRVRRPRDSARTGGTAGSGGSSGCPRRRAPPQRVAQARLLDERDREVRRAVPTLEGHRDARDGRPGGSL